MDDSDGNGWKFGLLFIALAMFSVLGEANKKRYEIVTASESLKSFSGVTK